MDTKAPVGALGYDHTKTMIPPQTQYVWQHPRLQDYKSMIDYNLTFSHDSNFVELKLLMLKCLKKTLSTFYASNIVLQQ